jgi:peptidoglycan/xylan/chitin deacetylase (PgdA/CDA1 family)
MRAKRVISILGAICCWSLLLNAQVAGAPASRSAKAGTTRTFHWPKKYRAAVSLSFDDARTSQIDKGLPLFTKLGVKVTFFVQPEGVQERLAGWKQAALDGHEIGNHSVSHPCTGNYHFSVDNALENYDLKRMVQQIDEANDRIQKLLGVKPKSFAYPCGQKFVGRGIDVESYVPFVAERFLVGRSYLSESSNDPVVVDLAQAMGTPFDDMDFAQMKEVVDEAAQQGRWVIFVGHEVGSRGYQVTDTKALEALCRYLKDPTNKIWLGTIEEIGSYVHQHQAGD